MGAKSKTKKQKGGNKPSKGRRQKTFEDPPKRGKKKKK